MAASSADGNVQSHQSTNRPRRGPRRWIVPAAVVGMAAVVTATVLVLEGNAGSGTAPAGCSGDPVTVTVATSSGLFPVLDGLARNWTATRPTLHGRCLTALVSRAEPNQVAAALGPDWNAGRGVARPDVWVPDSSLWLSLASGRPEASGLLPDEPPSIASSPVVLALREPMAQALGWPARTLSWADVIDAFTGDWAKAGHPEWSSLRIGMTDPNVSTSGLAAVLAILDQAGTGSLTDNQLVSALRFGRVLGSVEPDATRFFAAQAGGTGPDAAIAAFPALESQVSAYDADTTDQPLIPVYATAPLVADYPYAILNAGWVDADVRAAAGQFLRYLRDNTAQDVFGVAGMRGAQGDVRDAATLPVAVGFPASLSPARGDPDPGTLNQFVAQWAALRRQSNVLVTLDTSGSMSLPVPNTATTRLELMQQTASTGFGLLTNRSNIGLWDFSSQRAGRGEYRELVTFGPSTAPVGRVSRQQAMLDAVDELSASGNTPLYDTVYAAFHEMQAHWQPDSTNAVLLITDGANDLPGAGLTLNSLINKLTAEQRADRPVQVINIAVGPDADAAALQQISQATGGRTFVAKDPASAVQTLVLAFAGRLS